MSDDRLLQRYATERSQDAFAALMRKYFDFVYSTCRRQLGDGDLAQDATQAVFLVLASKAASLGRGTVLVGWLYRSAQYACSNARKVEARREHYEQLAAKEMAMSEPQHEDSGVLIDSELDAALAKLSAGDRDSILLKYVDELTIKDIGRVLNISESAAHKRVTRALDRLRRNLGDTVLTPSAVPFEALIAQQLTAPAPHGMAAALLGQFPNLSGGAGAIGSSGQIYAHIVKELLMTKLRVGALFAAVGIVLVGGLGSL